MEIAQTVSQRTEASEPGACLELRRQQDVVQDARSLCKLPRRFPETVLDIVAGTVRNERARRLPAAALASHVQGRVAAPAGEVHVRPGCARLPPLHPVASARHVAWDAGRSRNGAGSVQSSMFENGAEHGD